MGREILEKILNWGPLMNTFLLNNFPGKESKNKKIAKMMAWTLGTQCNGFLSILQSPSIG